jgi:3-hydroxyisobutyrate dehydrogenase
MGGPMALNVRKAGHELIVNDLRREAAKAHLEAGAKWADGARAIAEQSDVVFTSLPGPREAEAVGNELLEGMRPGAAWFDLSTNSPTVARRIHARFAAKKIPMLDAPVSGGPHGANSGKLALLVGGVKAGVDPLELWAAVRQCSLGRMRTFDRLGKQFLQGSFDPPDFALQLAHKDVTLATELGRELGVPMRIANLTYAEMTEALNRGWAQRDSRVPMLLQEERAGVEIKVPAAAIQEVLKRDG